MYPGRPSQNQGPGGPPMVQYPGMYYKSTQPAAPQWPTVQAAPASSAQSSNYVQYPSRYTAASSAHSATRSALAESYERIRNEMRGLSKGDTKPSHQPTPPAPTLKQKNDPLTSLCSNTSVSLSSLLEAAMAPNAGSSKRTTEDPIMKKTILGKCERKIAQLYRDRITGMGSFFPMIDTNATGVSEMNYLLHHCPRLEFNSDPVGAVWTCPDIKIDPKKPDPPKPEVQVPQTIATVGSLEIPVGNLPDISVPPPDIEPAKTELPEPPIDLVTDTTFEQWAEIERAKRQRERELQWQQLMLLSGVDTKSEKLEERKSVKRNRRSLSSSSASSSRGRSRSKSRSRRSRRRRSSSSQSRIRNRSRRRSRSRSRSRRQRSSSKRQRSSPRGQYSISRRRRSSSFSLSPSPPSRRRSHRSRDSSPVVKRRSPRREPKPKWSPPVEIISHPPPQSVPPSWAGPYSSHTAHPQPAPVQYGPGQVQALPEYSSGVEFSHPPPNYLAQQPPWPHSQPPFRMPYGPYGPPRGFPLPAPGMRPPGMGPWPMSRPGLPYRQRPPRGLCANPNLIPVSQLPPSLPEVIVIDDGDRSSLNSPVHPPGLSPEMETQPEPRESSVCLRTRCLERLGRIKKVHKNLYLLQRESAQLRETVYDMEAQNKEFHGVYAMIKGFLCKMEVGDGERSSASFKVVLPSTGVKSILWDIHVAYHRYTKQELLDLFEDLFYDSRNLTPAVTSIFEQCARCVSNSRQKERRSREKTEKLGDLRDKLSKSQVTRSEERENRHQHERRNRSKGPTDSQKKSRSPGKHSKERAARSSSRKSRSPLKASEQPAEPSSSKKSRSPRKHSKDSKDRDHLKISSSDQKSSVEETEEKSARKPKAENIKKELDETESPSNGVVDESVASKDSKSENAVEKTQGPETDAHADAAQPKIETPVAAVPENVKEPEQGKNTTGQKARSEKNSDTPSANSRSEKAADFKTRVRQVQSTVESLKKQIDDLEGPTGRTDEPSLLMKAGMLCRRLMINQKSEIKIVVTRSILPDMIQIVHTMAPVHAPAQKTVSVYMKHFSPMDDVDAEVAKVLDRCDTCNV